VYLTHFDSTFNSVDWTALRDSLRPQATAVSRDSVRTLIRGMLSRLAQSHFALIPQESADEPAGGRGEGTVGLDFRLIEGRVVVTRVDPEGPGERAGVRPGWVLLAADTNTVAALLRRLRERQSRYRLEVRAWSDVTAWLQGAPGDTVTLQFRDGVDRPVTIALTRAPDPGLPVKFGDLPTFYARFASRELALEPGFRVGIIEFNTWMVPLVRQVDSAVDALRTANGIVLDLRGNRGGVGAMVMGVAGHFTPRRDTLGLFRSRTTTLRFIANPRTVSPAGRPVEPFSGPVAILVDDMSGSASEVFAGGMQAIGRVRVFGATSLGGVLPASWDRLPNGDVLYHAIADFVTRDGIVLEGRGVIPEEPVPLTRADLLAGRDPVLDAAVRWIRRAARSQRGNP
ncbi:MAG: S41 family peptidase, partial [Gemmatimonadales bacterium]